MTPEMAGAISLPRLSQKSAEKISGDSVCSIVSYESAACVYNIWVRLGEGPVDS